MTRAAASLLLVACAAPGNTPPAAPATTAGPNDGLPASIDALAADVLVKTPAAGIAVAVSWHGETVVARGYGLADAERATPATAETVFRIGSITKQFTAAAILQLQAAHALALDDELVRYLPDYPTHGKRVTLRQLLTHTSGIHDYERGPWLAEHMGEARPGAELLASFAAEPFDFEPGARWQYSNSGYFLLGLVIERVAGQPYESYVRDHVLAAAGVTGVRYCPDEQDYPQAARGYDVVDGKRAPSRPIRMVYAYAAGALCATAPGLLAWTRALAHGRVVDAAAWREMTTPVRLADGGHYGYGLGLFVSELAGHRVIFHGGGINGFVSTLAYYPDDELYVAVLVDTDGSFADDLGEAIARLVLRAPRPATKDLTIESAEAAAVIGRYQVAAIGTTFVVELDGGKLFAHGEGGARRLQLLRQDDGSYLVPERGLRIEFERDGGRATKIRLVQAGMTFEGQRVP